MRRLLILSCCIVGLLGSQWVSVCGNEYLFSDDQDTWTQAKSNCHLYGGYLVQINGAIENACLHEYAINNINVPTNPGGVFWHSANDRQTESVYK